MKVLHITHNDLDGLGCGVLIKKFLPGSITTNYLSYDDIDSVIEKNFHKFDQIVITDVSPAFNTIEVLAGEKDVLLIDHHLTTEKLKKFPFTVHSTEKCATLLTYDYLISQGFKAEAYKRMAEAINDIDLWLLRGEEGMKLNMLFHLLGIARMEERLLQTPFEGFTEAEKLLISIEEDRKENYIKKAMKNLTIHTDKANLRFAAVFAESYASELGNTIIAQNIADYVIMINAQGRRVSLRSRKDVSIVEIAERMNGGGHKNAAGFPAPRGEDFNMNSLLERMGLI